MSSQCEQEAADLGRKVYEAIQKFSNYDARSMQSREFRVGLSDLGFCSERTRRMLDGQVPDDTDSLAAFIGTAIGDHVEQAVEMWFPDEKVIRQAEVSLTLESESGRTYVIPGHPDLIFPDSGIMLDVKTTYGLSMVKRNGPSQSQQFQRHCYAKAAHEAGLFGDLPLEEVKVANFWLDRGAVDKEPHVHMEHYDEGQVIAAGQWLDDVVYAYLQGEEARKEPPRELCAVACGFYTVCRAYDTDVQGLIRDEEALSAVALYREGIEMEKQGKRLKDEAKQHLVGVQGSTGEFMVRWVHVNASEVSFTRDPYEKLDIRAVPKRKVKAE